MQFTRLRIAGFKSFVEPAEFRIEPGLTGVVGPNGCGKSNLLEALRWVMGAGSAKALRAGAMDDVIFAGAQGRPAREHAEVVLTIDNAERRAPAAFNDADVIEVSRRIDRGQGSAYRVNGREARARDVQLLFADASTGANSPSLVRQGQISELIAAKPANRRRILEEAAGVSGLHARRHEAELRLTAAEANGERLDEVAAGLEAQLARLGREARRAETYRRLAADIRSLRAAVLGARWAEADAAAAEAARALAEAEAAATEAAREAARSAVAVTSAAEALPPLRDAATAAAAVLRHAEVGRDLLEREAADAEAALARAQADAARIAADRAREAAAEGDATGAVRRLEGELADLDAALASAPARLPELEAALARAAAARAEADAGLERRAAARAAAEAERAAARRAAESAEAAARAAAERAASAVARRDRLGAAVASADAERAALAPVQAGGGEAEALARAEAALATARADRDAAEAARAAAMAEEARARTAHREADDGLRRVQAEARGLRELAAGGRRGPHAPALDRVRPQPGLEAAVAAALGDDGEAALDPAAPAHWAGASAPAPAWPPGAEPLGPRVEAPPELAARLALTALVARADGERLRGALPAGARLVSREGDLWRWDGLTVRADAPRPAAVRLAQRARLEAAEARAVALAPAADATAAKMREAEAAARSASEAARSAAAALPAAERALGAARDAAERVGRDAALREARRAALDEAAARIAGERAEAETQAEAAEREAAEARAAAEAARAAPGPPSPAADAEDGEARAAAARTREAEGATRAALDGERRSAEARARRRDHLARDLADWARRLRAAAARGEALRNEAEVARAAGDAARALPQALAGRRGAAEHALAQAQVRRAQAADALAEAEAAALAADRTARGADAASAAARERRAVDAARLEAAQARLAEAAEALRTEAGLEPETLRERLAADAVALPSDPAALDAHLRALEARRDALGPVNLRAAEEAAEVGAQLETMQAERADLAGAVAKLRAAVQSLNAEGRERLLVAFSAIDADFQSLFQTLFEGGEARLALVESPDPLEAGLEIYACPPGKRLAAMTLMSGGEQALTATALIFAVFLSNPSPVCVLDEVDAPLDDANVDRFCRMLDAMRTRTATRFIAITHNPVTMSRMDRLFGVTMAERGVSQLVGVDLRGAEALAAE